MAIEACRVEIAGVVQGVGFRPFVYRLARQHGISGWVCNDNRGVLIHAEGAAGRLGEFRRGLASPPPAARIATASIVAAEITGCSGFEIRHSDASAPPSAHISPDLAICEACTAELRLAGDRRCGYPYINCTDCGPRYSIVLGLPYDRARSTLRDWPLCDPCAAEYHDPGDRRFHAQPVACPDCGPGVALEVDSAVVAVDGAAIARAAQLLADGAIVAIKGLGGYHLACNARDSAAVALLRRRKRRQAKPFALMARDPATAEAAVELARADRDLLESVARPVVIGLARVELPGVAPGCREFGLMLPYAPVHHLLFDAGAPALLVMTSGNLAGEPIAYEDDAARRRLAGLAEAILVGERPIARRVDDSVLRVGAGRSVVLRRARGLAPGTVARWTAGSPILALGADLKNTVTLVVDGEAIMSQHIGDLDHPAARSAHGETLDDLRAMYAISPDHLTIVHDLHPQYASSLRAAELAAAQRLAVQHHRAHLASVLAEHGAFEEPVIGLVLDGSGYGDDGSVWGGEMFAGSLNHGFERVGHLRPAVLAGGDAAALWPVQAAAGFLDQLDEAPDLTAEPFAFPDRYRLAVQLVASGVQTFPTTSVGRLFDTVAALLGFTEPITFEGQAAVWLEQLASSSSSSASFELPFVDRELDFRPLLGAVFRARLAGEEPAAVARAFHRGLAQGLRRAARRLCRAHGISTVALSGGVFQNLLLLDEVVAGLEARSIRVWTHRRVPANDGGISLGQAALAAARISLSLHPPRDPAAAARRAGPAPAPGTSHGSRRGARRRLPAGSRAPS